MEPRKASVALLYNGKNATAQVSPYLASFTYTDVSSGSSDTISVELNDRDRKWIGPWFPQTGDRLKPTIRTQNWDADNIKTSFLSGTFLSASTHRYTSLHSSGFITESSITLFTTINMSARTDALPTDKKKSIIRVTI